MKLYAECLPCLLKRVYYETKLIDDRKSFEILKVCAKIIGKDAGSGVVSAIIATKVHKVTYNMLGNSDPYREIKDASNRVALKLYPRAERFVNNSKDPFKAAVIVSIVGNIFDYGVTDFRDPKLLFKSFDKMCAEGLGHDDLPAIKKILKKSKKVVYFTDNCGEIVFDRLLLKELKNRGMHITLVPKGVPILSDATADDVRKIGLQEYADEIVPTEHFAVGVDVKRMSGKFKMILDEADLIICKGMANYEALSETKYRPVAYLMRSKCEPVALALGVKKDVNVAKIFL